MNMDALRKIARQPSAVLCLLDSNSAQKIDMKAIYINKLPS